ncbi:hypothetical protein [Streptomyces sp. NPDC046821]|uniref:hypothetical protein n=1 Tax=Streptomyces sp. NPDC046821 TaxID=3154702 RepID=UPI0033CBFB2D
MTSALLISGCGTGSESKAPKNSASGSGSATSKSQEGSLTWEFEHISDFSGEITDLAALSEDDIWAVAIENNGRSDAHLLHFDGTGWKREPLPDAVGAPTYPPRLEEVGPDTLWLRPNGQRDDVHPWAKWDGARWTSVPNSPPGEIADFEADSPDDIWVLDYSLVGQPFTARHWDGTRWTTTRLPHRAADLEIAGPDDVWAVGHRSTGPGTEYVAGLPYIQPATMHWDGTSWKSVETPEFRFEDPMPPEPGATLYGAFALDDGEVLTYGENSFNHGEMDHEPADEYIRLRWDDSRWAEQEPAPGNCGQRVPMAQDDEGLFLYGNWYLTDDGRCVKIKRHRLPLSTGARKTSNQSLWLNEVHRVPGTDEWLGAGHVQVNQSGSPFGAPVVVRLKRGG